MATAPPHVQMIPANYKKNNKLISATPQRTTPHRTSASTLNKKSAVAPTATTKKPSATGAATPVATAVPKPVEAAVGKTNGSKAAAAAAATTGGGGDHVPQHHPQNQSTPIKNGGGGNKMITKVQIAKLAESDI